MKAFLLTERVRNRPHVADRSRRRRLLRISLEMARSPGDRNLRIQTERSHPGFV